MLSSPPPDALQHVRGEVALVDTPALVEHALDVHAREPQGVRRGGRGGLRGLLGLAAQQVLQTLEDPRRGAPVLGEAEEQVEPTAREVDGGSDQVAGVEAPGHHLAGGDDPFQEVVGLAHGEIEEEQHVPARGGGRRRRARLGRGLQVDGLEGDDRQRSLPFHHLEVGSREPLDRLSVVQHLHRDLHQGHGDLGRSRLAPGPSHRQQEHENAQSCQPASSERQCGHASLLCRLCAARLSGCKRHTRVDPPGKEPRPPSTGDRNVLPRGRRRGAELYGSGFG